MAELIARYGQMKHPSQGQFQALMRAIVAQQISTKAADTIRSRIEVEVGTSPGDFSGVSLERLRTILQGVAPTADLALATKNPVIGAS